MKAGTLDSVTSNTFKWMKNRLTAAEKEKLEQDKNLIINRDQSADDPAPKPLHIINRDKRADKGRIRRIKEKVIRIKTRPRSQQEEMLSPDWLALFDSLPDPAEIEYNPTKIII